MLLPASAILVASMLGARLSQDSTHRVAGWRADVKFLVAEAQKVHAGPTRPARSSRFVEAAASLAAQIPQLPDRRIVVEIQKLLAMLGDGHSLVYPIASSRAPFTMLPVDVYLFADGLFVVDGPRELRGLVGSRITHIGGRRTEAVVRGLEPFVSRDNLMGLKAFAGLYLIIPAFLEALGVTEDSERVTLTVDASRGGRQQITLTGTSPRRIRRKLFPPLGAVSPPPLYLRNADRNYRVCTLSAPRVVYLQFNQVADDPDEPLAAFSRRVADTLAASQAENLIVDVRHNNGGNNTLLEPLLIVLADYANLAPRRRIYVITSRTTFSAAQNFINRLERRVASVTFAGEPSMSSPNFTGEDTPLTLPFSGLTVSISTRYWQDSDSTDHRPWIQPHLAIALSSKDWLANHDPVLDAVLREIRTAGAKHVNPICAGN